MRKTAENVAIRWLAVAMMLAVGACTRAMAEEPGPWAPSLHHALSQSTHDHQLVFVYYANDWDPWCRRMEEETFRDREVRNALASYHLVRIVPNQKPEDTNKYDVYLCPSFIILDHRGEQLFHVVGFRTPAQMMRELARARQSEEGASAANAGKAPAPAGARTR